jgi:chromatin structure-remodeling complex subunit RSC9
MRSLFAYSPGAEQTQLSFWTLYKDTFTPFIDKYPLLAAPDLIKNVTIAFAQAHAMVLPGNPQRFVIQNIKRVEKDPDLDRFKCRWERDQCTAEPFKTADDLHTHILGHLTSTDPLPCLWSSCEHAACETASLRHHLVTHLPLQTPRRKYAGQPVGVTLPEKTYPHPSANPTARAPPPAPTTLVKYPVTSGAPSSTSLTILLILRILFHYGFSANTAMPVASDERFGCPSLPTEDGDEEVEEQSEGEKKVRQAFLNVARRLQGIRMADKDVEHLIPEMIVAMDGIVE